uniref:NADH dehydrogenase subunit 4L n=1 Tax=Dirofilaria repens TaxID=31241 RepID=A0A141CQS5_9BILA|nr:NADH dehydrogenase subunit 4L [Dirofilaria repens]AKU47223.1 NADH dehydrogenase subunit 4L [Dirofilaria repens]AOP18648.1 NADH dehydrogenase subunit 4L [Dirofilaria repens]AOP18660.1 NADH dehydrogenase subunit 4L [Dirofilaria repens]AOP18672.1 NADH dehydrogenase subunit 4L [Dirofilaria repens]AOP18691.1 NADH dehydrogenase subunit 4L [Dirofilaria repens]
MFFLSFLFLVFKYSRLIFVLIGIEFLFFSLLVYYVFFFESVFFFYFLCFGVVSSVVGLVVFFFCVKGYGFDKVMFYFL